MNSLRSFPAVSLVIVASTLVWSSCTTDKSYPGPVHGLTLDGTVQSINLTNQALVLSPSKPGEPVTFYWDKTTKFWKNGIPIRPREVESGASVRVHYHIATPGEIPSATSQYVAHHVYVQVPYAPEH